MEARPYANAITEIVRSVAARMEHPAHPLLVRRPEKRALLVIVTGDRGLAGAFSSNAVRRGVEFLRSHMADKSGSLAHWTQRPRCVPAEKWPVLGEYVGITARAEFAKAQEIAAKSSRSTRRKNRCGVSCCSSEFKSVITQKMVFEKLLPIDPAAPDASGSQVDYIYDQPAEEILSGLMPRYVEARIYRMLADSSAAEHAARMTAMDAATNNAYDLIESLTLQMNKIRQAAITKEIIEVVSGASWSA